MVPSSLHPFLIEPFTETAYAMPSLVDGMVHLLRKGLQLSQAPFLTFVCGLSAPLLSPQELCAQVQTHLAPRGPSAAHFGLMFDWKVDDKLREAFVATLGRLGTRKAPMWSHAYERLGDAVFQPASQFFCVSRALATTIISEWPDSTKGIGDFAREYATVVQAMCTPSLNTEYACLPPDEMVFVPWCLLLKDFADRCGGDGSGTGGVTHGGTRGGTRSGTRSGAHGGTGGGTGGGTSGGTRGGTRGGTHGGTCGGTCGGTHSGTCDATGLCNWIDHLLDTWLPKCMLVQMTCDDDLTQAAPLISGWDSPKEWFRGAQLTMAEARVLLSKQSDKEPPCTFVRKLCEWEHGVPYLHQVPGPSDATEWMHKANSALYESFGRATRHDRCQWLRTLTYEAPGSAFVAEGAAELESSLRSHLPSQPIGFTVTVPSGQGCQPRKGRRFGVVEAKAVARYDNVIPGHHLSSLRRMWRVEMRGRAPLYEQKLSNHSLQGCLPGYASVLQSVKGVVGDDATLLYIDILDGAVSFDYHQDTEEERGQQITVVVKLSEGHSSVCIAGSQEIAYGLCSGGAVAFPSKAYHRTGVSIHGQLKIVFFFTRLPVCIC